VVGVIIVVALIEIFRNDKVYRRMHRDCPVALLIHVVADGMQVFLFVGLGTTTKLDASIRNIGILGFICKKPFVVIWT